MSTMSSDQIWITGAGIVSALGNDFVSFAKALRRGEDAVRPITAFDASALRGHMGCEVRDFFPQEHFNCRELRRMDRSSCMLVVAAREAMTRAGLKHGDYNPERGAISLGTSLGGMIEATNYYSHLKTTGKGYVTRLIDYPLYAAGTRTCAEHGLLGAN